MEGHLTHYRVLYRDTDSMGVLYYGRYFELFELGRTEWLRDEGLRYRDMERDLGLILPVTRAECHYRGPLHFDDLAEVRTVVHGWTTSTLSFAHEIHSNESGRLCAAGRVELGCVTRAEWRPSRLPAAYSEMLQRVVPEARGRRLG